eukprot:TRINITY_DN8522_c0_g1_i1.p2 TRINITY_DN8522_c0_g1~~TRINITY_DN8522_c0_g1_i1.p2  ORF type:complete len:179 (+),score=24.86 TRINITY_DN8522_c0_g1_i1:174-710(+)
MNSVLQQLYMIPDFRDTILAQDLECKTLSKQDNLIYQLQLVFQNLKSSLRMYYEPKQFCHTFAGKNFNVAEQMDADEFFNSFMEKLEQQLQKSNHQNIVKQTFGGMFANEVIGKQCQHVSEREELFYTVSLIMKNQKCIQDALANFVQGEILEGDNSCLLYTSPSPRDRQKSRMPSSA